MLKKIFLLIFISVSSFAAKENFKKNDVILPKGRVAVKTFLNLLNDSENQKTVGIKNLNVIFTEVPNERSTIFTSEGSDYMLYEDDFSNSGTEIYLVIYLHSGSGNYSGVKGAYRREGNKLMSLNFDEIVVKNLFPNGDMSRFHMKLANPFAVKNHGRIIMRFLDEKPLKIHSYIWEKNKFTEVKE